MECQDMQDLVEELASKVGIEPALAEKATAAIVDFVSRTASPELVETLKSHLPSFDDLAARGAADAASGAEEAAGGLFGGGLGGLIGGLFGGEGPLGEAMALVGRLGRDGIDLGQIRAIAGGLVDHLRTNGGNELVDRFLAEIPGAGHLLG
jgi:predicted lipid-binding transport protein (Tim44 family)